MSTSLRLMGNTALASVLLAQGAFADVTSSQVWNEFESYLTGFGYTITATEAATGNGLTVSDVTMSVDVPEEDMTVMMTMDALVLTDQGDGSVNMAFPAIMPIVIQEGDGSQNRFTLNYETGDLSLVISGTPEEMTYNYTASQLVLSLGELLADGEVVPRENADGRITMSGLSGVSVWRKGNLREIEQEAGFANVTYNIKANEPGGDANFSLVGSMEQVGFAGSTAMPFDIDTTQMADALRAGFAVEGGFAYTNGNFQMSGAEDGDVFNAQGSSNEASIGFAMDESGMSYFSESLGTKIMFMGGDIPFPVNLAMDGLAMEMAMPISSSDEEQPFVAAVQLDGFTMADLLWNIFDPGQILPRDPASIAMRATGTAKLFFDLMDEEQMMEAGMSSDMPGELNSLTIENLSASAVGASLQGQGDFTFDNTDLDTFDGLPRPIGGIELSVAGANGLIDNLIKMGLLAEEDAMGARMMMSMFGVPGEGEDTLNSVLEINEQGHILANGMRIQ